MNKKNELILVRHSKEPADDRVFTFARLNGLIPIEKFPFQGDLLGEPTERTFGTVIYGGQFSVLENNIYPFLREEANWISSVSYTHLTLPTT